MIQYLEHNQIDKKKWDATIEECGNIYAYSWYLDVVHPQWEALVEGDYDTVMPLTGGEKFGVHYLFQPYFVLFSYLLYSNIRNNYILFVF